MQTEEDLAKASAAALSGIYGPNLLPAVEGIAAGRIPIPERCEATRNWGSAIGTAAAIVQIAIFVFEVSRHCWNAYKDTRDKKAAEAAARGVAPPPGVTGTQREEIIRVVADKLP